MVLKPVASTPNSSWLSSWTRLSSEPWLRRSVASCS